MALVIGGLALVALLFGPSLWVRHVLARHGAPRPDLPGTGGELARHLVERAGLDGVRVETTAMGDHYDGRAKAIRLSPDHHAGRSVTAAVVAAHEFGHALQDAEGWGPYRIRAGAARIAQTLGYLAQAAFVIGVVAGFSTLSPHLAAIGVGLALLATLAAVLLHVATLPVEIDASFRRALPILRAEGYLPAGDIPAARSVLTACAATYVAAALMSSLNLLRWLRFVR